MSTTDTCPACDEAAVVTERDCCGLSACDDCAAGEYCCETAETEAFERAESARRAHDRRLAAIRREMWLQGVAARALYQTRIAVALIEVREGRRPAIYADVERLAAEMAVAS